MPHQAWKPLDAECAFNAKSPNALDRLRLPSMPESSHMHQGSEAASTCNVYIYTCGMIALE